jgi:hypothetical protein
MNKKISRSIPIMGLLMCGIVIGVIGASVLSNTVSLASVQVISSNELVSLTLHEEFPALSWKGAEMNATINATALDQEYFQTTIPSGWLYFEIALTGTDLAPIASGIRITEQFTNGTNINYDYKIIAPSDTWCSLDDSGDSLIYGYMLGEHVGEPSGLYYEDTIQYIYFLNIPAGWPSGTYDFSCWMESA